jgi:ectoine hydroxylase-related dioxygenase (phytanoyl-CoA dioxygenase family)
MSAAFMDEACGGYCEIPYEAVMNAGDVLIWHHWCVHASSTNSSDRIRQAIITRFHTTEFGEQQRNDAGGVATDLDLWKYWGGAVRQAAARCDEAAKL